MLPLPVFFDPHVMIENRTYEYVAARRSLTEVEAHIILSIRLSAKPRFCTPERKLKEVLMVGSEGLRAFVALSARCLLGT